MKAAKQRRIRHLIPYATIIFVFIAIVLLGAVFVQGYDVGTARPQPTGSGLIVNTPVVQPQSSPVAIADTATLPEELPNIPAPSKQAVTRHVRLAPAAPTRPAPKPLNPIAEAATNATKPVADAVHDAVNDTLNQLPVPTLTPELPKEPSIPPPIN